MKQVRISSSAHGPGGVAVDLDLATSRVVLGGTGKSSVRPRPDPESQEMPPHVQLPQVIQH